MPYKNSGAILQDTGLADNGKVHMGGINWANLKKTWYYLRRNGLRSAFAAARERILEEKKEYAYAEPSAEALEAQRNRIWEYSPLFSIVVPAYRTAPEYLGELIESVLGQTYAKWELIIADATEDDSVEAVVRAYEDDRIRYLRLPGNQGIAENTNLALEQVRGGYTGLLDHDDVLTADALYEMAHRITCGESEGVRIGLLYSDEDKCNQNNTCYFEPHYKEKFNLDLLLNNNYICHFLVMDSRLLQKLGLRGEFDGAQDFDLVLRAAGELMERPERIAHIPKILYHWRCHTGSTAANPQSKRYAYEAGLRAVQDFADARGWNARAVERKHLGFYALRYKTDIFTSRPDVGAEGGRLVCRGKVAGGMLREDGVMPYQGLPAGFSGYMHRAALCQDAAALDIRCIRVRPECRKLFEQVTGAPYREVPGGGCFDYHTLPPDADMGQLSLALGAAMRAAGYRLVWNPDWTGRLPGRRRA